MARLGRRAVLVLRNAVPVMRAVRVLFVCVVVVLGLAPARASAKRYEIPRVEDGVGVKVGERSTFHGGAALSAGFDSNVYNEHASEGPRRAGFVIGSGWIGIGNREVRDDVLMTEAERSNRLLDYNVSFGAAYREYLGPRGLMRKVLPSFNVEIHTAILPGRRFSVHTDVDAFYGVLPGNYDASGSDDYRLGNIARLDVRSRPAIFVFRPGGGRLSLSIGTRLDVRRFPRNPELNALHRRVYGFGPELKWRFLPKSALVFHYTFDYTDYVNDNLLDPYKKTDNFAHRILGGFRGQVFKRATLDVMLGMGIASYWQDRAGPRDGALFRGAIGEVAFNYYPTLTSRIYLAAFRTFNDALFGNYFVDMGGRARVSYQFRWRMTAHVGGQVAAREVRGLPALRDETSLVETFSGPGAAEYERHHTLVNLDAGLEQPLGRLFSLALRYTLFVDARPFRVEYRELNPLPDRPAPVDVLGFTKHFVWLMAAIRI